jgi:hypothetical protein
MSNTYWIIGRGTAADDIPVDYVTEGDRPTPRRGGTVTLQCVFVDDLIDYDTLDEPALTGRLTRFRELESYLQYLDGVSIISGVDGAAYLHEQLPRTADIQTTFISVDPPDTITTEPFYGAVTGGTVATQGESNRNSIDLEVTYLADVSEYPTRKLARDALIA